MPGVRAQLSVDVCARLVDLAALDRRRGL